SVHVSAETAPSPLVGFGHQAALHRIAMHVAQFLNSLARRPHIQVEAFNGRLRPLPKSRASRGIIEEALPDTILDHIVLESTITTLIPHVSQKTRDPSTALRAGMGTRPKLILLRRLPRQLRNQKREADLRRPVLLASCQSASSVRFHTPNLSY